MATPVAAMELSDDEREKLLARYEIWGPDRVRAELLRSDRELFARPEATAFAEEWLAHVTGEHRRSRTRKLLLLLAAAGLAAGIAIGLVG